MKPAPTIVILGAGGLIGHGLATDLLCRGFRIIPVARRFTPAQRAALGEAAQEWPAVDLAPAELARRLAALAPDIVVNCIGVLQDGARGGTGDVHAGFVVRLLEALSRLREAVLLAQVSIPGAPADDRTPFSISKRQAEEAIRSSGRPFLIVRPGFVIAPAAYGGSALVRALAASPLALPAAEAGAPFATTALADIADTIAWAATGWREGRRDWAETFDVMSPRATTLEDVVAACRVRFGGTSPICRLPRPLLAAGALAGDIASKLGWQPPVRSTALAELRRGVAGEPQAWMAATGLEARSLEGALALVPATVQERWFARLYLLKPLMLACLVLFWTASGLIALTVAFEPARAILLAHGIPGPFATAMTIVSSLADIAVGLAVAMRRTCRIGLLAGIALSLFYMAGAALITPALWIEPLGALVKTGPAIVLMLVALTTLDDR